MVHEIPWLEVGEKQKNEAHKAYEAYKAYKANEANKANKAYEPNKTKIKNNERNMWFSAKER